MLTQEENELLTRTGPGTPMGNLMRRYWVPALFSNQLPVPDCPPVRVRLLGEDLVAFRDSAGRVGLLEQHCAHRGASLFFGRNEESGLRCVYHGWKYDVDGQCVDMPNEPPESKFKDKIRQRSYPCRDRGGIVWAYLGPPELKPELPELEWAMVPDAQRFATRHLQECNWLQALEGGFDPSHVAFLHGGGRSLAGSTGRPVGPIGGTMAHAELIETDYGYMVGDRRDLEGDQTFWAVNQWLMPFFKMIRRFREDDPIGAHAWVPIDDEHCMTYTIEWHPFRPIRNEEIETARSWQWIHAENLPGSDATVMNQGNDYLIDRELQRSGRSYTGIKGTGMQDTAVQESMGPIYDRTTEQLGSSDFTVIAIRLYLLRVLHELEKGRTPPGLDPASHHVRSAAFTAPRALPFKEAAANFVTIES